MTVSIGSPARRLCGAILVALAVPALAPASTHASHNVFEQVSAGAINGDGPFGAFFHRVSDDGTRVFFGTQDRLVSGDTDDSIDVYELSGGITRRVSAGATGGNGAFHADFRGATPDGTRVFFTTDEKLVSADTDDSVDTYQRSGSTTTRVSAGAINGNGAFDAIFNAVSTDGTRVFFTTREQLTSDEKDESPDIYQRSGGTTTRVSRGAINGNGAFEAAFYGASADGTRVFFLSNEKLANGDTDDTLDVYERSGGTTTLVSAGAINGNGAFQAFFVAASADGTRVFFETDEKLVNADTDDHQDLYERAGGTTRRVSAGAINGNGPVDAIFRRATPDGSRVFFVTLERLASGDTDNALDLYERAGGTTRRVSVGAINGNGLITADFGGASADGTRVFFTTQEQLVSGDMDGQFGAVDVYERSGGTTRLVSVGTINGNGNFQAGVGGVSADGTRVFFVTGEQLVSEDTDNSFDIYERFGGVTTLVSRGVITGNDGFHVTFEGASADGTDVFFETREQLVGGDQDAVTDVYAARMP